LRHGTHQRGLRNDEAERKVAKVCRSRAKITHIVNIDDKPPQRDCMFASAIFAIILDRRAHGETRGRIEARVVDQPRKQRFDCGGTTVDGTCVPRPSSAEERWQSRSWPCPEQSKARSAPCRSTDPDDRTRPC